MSSCHAVDLYNKLYGSQSDDSQTVSSLSQSSCSTSSQSSICSTDVSISSSPPLMCNPCVGSRPFRDKDSNLSRKLGVCCSSMCLFYLPRGSKHLSPIQSAAFHINECHGRMKHLTSTERMHQILLEIEKGYKGMSKCGYVCLELTLETGGPVVCSSAFRTAYNIGLTTFKKLCSRIKSRQLNFSEEHTKRNERLTALQRRNIERDYFNIPHATDQLAMEFCPDTPLAMSTFVWMKNHFDVIGEAMPVGWGSFREIHLDSGTLKTKVWEEYKYVYDYCLFCSKVYTF